MQFVLSVLLVRLRIVILPFNMTDRGRVRLPCNMLIPPFDGTDRGSVTLSFNILRLRLIY